jgi:hypothetical protein
LYGRGRHGRRRAGHRPALLVLAWAQAFGQAWNVEVGRRPDGGARAVLQAG